MSEQAVADADAPNKSDAQAEVVLDVDAELAKLSEEEAKPAQPKTEPKPEAKPQAKSADGRVDDVLQILQLRDIEDAAKTVVELAGDITLDRNDVEIMLRGKASVNEDLVKAFDDRFRNPAKWKKALTIVAQEIGKKFAKPKTKDADEMESAAAAARSTQPTPRNIDKDVEKEARDLSSDDWRRKHMNRGY